MPLRARNRRFNAQLDAPGIPTQVNRENAYNGQFSATCGRKQNRPPLLTVSARVFCHFVTGEPMRKRTFLDAIFNFVR